MEAYQLAISSEELSTEEREAALTLRYDFGMRDAPDVLAGFLGRYTAVRSAVGKAVNGKFQPRLKQAFLDLYALHAAAASLATGNEALDLELSVDHHEGDPAIRQRLTLAPAFKLYERAAAQGDVVQSAQALLRGIAETTAAVANEPVYREIREHCRSYDLLLGEQELTGVFATSLEQRLASASPVLVKAESVIGNHAFKRALRAGLSAIADYRKSERLIDLIDIPLRINAYGPPGTGKTSTIRECYAWAKEELEPAMVVPLELLVISNEVKSKYYGESAQHVAEIFDEIERGEKAYLFCIEDIDKVLSGGNSESTEERSLVETVMRRLEGLTSSSLQNYVLVTTTNKPLVLSGALDQRLSQCSVNVPGPVDAGECNQILSLKLGKAFDQGYASFTPEIFGESLYAYRFTGRDINNVAKTAYSIFLEQNDLEVPTVETLVTAIADGARLTEEMVAQAITTVLQKQEEKKALQLEAEMVARKRQLQVDFLARKALQEEVAQELF